MGKSVQHIIPPTTVNDHVRELLMRLFACFVVMTIAGIVVFMFYSPILAFLSSPLGEPLYYSTPAGSFNFIMKICLTGALIVAIPVIAYNIIMFIRPAFSKSLSMKRVMLTALSSTVLAVSGAVFAFYLILPGTLKFFSDFQVTGLNALISADSYLSFLTSMITMFVLVFQIPLIIMFIDHIKPLKPINLLKKGPWVIVGSLIITILQPFTYDFVTSLYIALPMIVLYYLSIIVVVAQHAKEKRKQSKTVSAVIVKPSLSYANTVNDLSLSEQALELLADELSNLDKPAVLPAIPTIKPTMDVGKNHIQPKTVQPPAWIIERNAKRQALATKTNVFSDFKQPSGARRALA